MELITILVHLFYLCYFCGADQTVGIEEKFVNINNISGYPVKNFTMPTFTNMTGLISSKIQESLLNYKFIIYSYDPILAFLTTQTNIPYFVIPELKYTPVLQKNAYYFPSFEERALECTNYFLNQINARATVFIDYQPISQLTNLITSAKFPETYFSVDNKTDFAKLFIQTLEFNFYVSSIPMNETNLIETVLKEAMLKGQLNPGKTWIFTSLETYPTTIFNKYFNVSALIYGLSLEGVGLMNSQTFAVKRFYEILTAGEINKYFINNKYKGTTVNFKFLNSIDTTTKYQCTDKIVELKDVLNLNNPLVTVRVGVILSKGFFMQKPTEQYYGYSVAIMRELQNLTKFNYVYRFPSNVTKNGTYHQLNSLIRNNEADIILIPMVINYIDNLSYPSDVALTMSISMITRGPDVPLASVSLAPFNYNIWLAILLIIFLMTVGFFTISVLSPSHNQNSSNQKSKSYSFGFSLLVIYSSFVMAKLKVKILQFSTQIFAFILWFSTLTIVITYAANLLPILMKTNFLYPFNNSSYFVKNPNGIYKWAFVRDSVDISLIQNIPDLSILYNKSSSLWPNEMFVDDMTSESIFQKSGMMLIQNSLKNSYIFNTLNCNSDIIPTHVQSYQLVFIMSNKFKQREEMKNMLSVLINKGIMTQLSQEYFDIGPCAREAISYLPSGRSLEINRLFILFLFPLCGCFFGVLFVILAILLGKCHRCVKNINREKFLVGQNYDAKVQKVDSGGIWASINQRSRPYYIPTSSLHPDLRKRFTPEELEISSGDILQLKYFGKDPINGYKRFCKDFSEA